MVLGAEVAGDALTFPREGVPPRFCAGIDDLTVSPCCAPFTSAPFTSAPFFALSTANLYFPSQPGQSLFGLQTSAPPNP